MNVSPYPSDVQFAGLVQAATAAAGQEEGWIVNQTVAIAQRRNQVDAAPVNKPSLTASTPSGPRKRKRGESEELPQGQYVPVGNPTDYERAPVPYESRPIGTGSNEGIASALFREPSEHSRRYTRPPMSSLYTSLQLAPENFLRLQAAAKDYMLDEKFPDRQDCVGQRGAGENSDMVKLKLWNCVQEFLDQHGHGERYWGHHVGDTADQAARSLFWPENAQKIIKLCVPLLRRMVTNERQRRYAAESRKGGDKTQKLLPNNDQEDSLIITECANFDASAEASNLNHQSTSSLVPAGTLKPSRRNAKAPTTLLERQPNIANLPNGPRNSTTLLVNLITRDPSSSSGKRLVPRFSLTPESVSNLASLRAEVQQRYYAVLPSTAASQILTSIIKVWLPDGLVQVKDDGEWMVALLSAEMVEWMDGEVRIVIELQES